MPAPTRVFIHGLDSSSRGTKGTFFRERYPGMEMADYDGPLEERMAQLERQLAGRDRLILVGSSYGGLMAALFACRNAGRVQSLVLLAPALAHGGPDLLCPHPLSLPVTIYHGRHDAVVDPEETRRLAARLFRDPAFHLVEDDHNLHRVFPTLDWDRLLEYRADESLDKAGAIL